MFNLCKRGPSHSSLDQTDYLLHSFPIISWGSTTNYRAFQRADFPSDQSDPSVNSRSSRRHMDRRTTSMAPWDVHASMSFVRGAMCRFVILPCAGCDPGQKLMQTTDLPWETTRKPWKTIGKPWKVTTSFRETLGTINNLDNSIAMLDHQRVWLRVAGSQLEIATISVHQRYQHRTLHSFIQPKLVSVVAAYQLRWQPTSTDGSYCDISLLESFGLSQMASISYAMQIRLIDWMAFHHSTWSELWLLVTRTLTCGRLIYIYIYITSITGYNGISICHWTSWIRLSTIKSSWQNNINSNSINHHL